MKLSEHKALKAEILALPQKEKDKLLLRLVAKDKVLTEHLHFLLLEEEEDLRNRVAVIKQEIITSENKDNAKEVLVALRAWVKLINHFLKVTKANFEEVELRIFLLNHITAEFNRRTFSSFKNYEQLYAVFFVKAVLATVRKFEKLHEDLQFDLKEDLNKLLNKSYTKNKAAIAIDLRLPKEI